MNNSEDKRIGSRFNLDENDLRFVAGFILIIVIIGSLLVTETSKNYDNLSLVLAGFFVGGSLLSRIKKPEDK